MTSTAPDPDATYEAVSPLEDLLLPTIEELDAIAGGNGAGTGHILTGFFELDHLTTGLMPGSLTVIGGYPGAGSSTLAMDFTRSAGVRHDIPALFLTLDSRPDHLVRRLLSSEARVKHGEMRSGRMSDQDWTGLARRMVEVREAPIFIGRPVDRDITAVTGLVTDLVEDHDVRLVVIDPLHMVTARTDLPYENREREIAEIVRRLKTLALDTETAIVVTSHLTNNPGPRQAIPARPSLSDLRDSGTIAHVADLVILIERPDLWERDHPRGGEADLIVAKHRFGPTATLTVAHQMHLCRFMNIAASTTITSQQQ